MYKVEKSAFQKFTWLTKHRGAFFKVKYSPSTVRVSPWATRNLAAQRTHLPADTTVAIYVFPSFLFVQFPQFRNRLSRKN